MTDELGSSTAPAVRVLYALGTGAAAVSCHVFPENALSHRSDAF